MPINEDNNEETVQWRDVDTIHIGTESARESIEELVRQHHRALLQVHSRQLMQRQMLLEEQYVSFFGTGRASRPGREIQSSIGEPRETSPQPFLLRAGSTSRSMLPEPSTNSDA